MSLTSPSAGQLTPAQLQTAARALYRSSNGQRRLHHEERACALPRTRKQRCCRAVAAPPLATHLACSGRDLQLYHGGKEVEKFTLRRLPLNFFELKSQKAVSNLDFMPQKRPFRL